jgi:outer membrane protein
MPRASHRLALIAVLTLSALSARAENLQELYQAGLAYDATYLSARASLDAAQFRLDQVYALRRPGVSLSVSGGRSLNEAPGAPSQRQTSATQYGATINGTQSLFNRPNDKTITQAEKALDVARTDFAAAEQDLIIRVSQAYFDVLAAQDTLATARSSLAAISEQVASAKRNFEVGTATITDTREAQARYDLARATEIVADNDLTNKRVALDQLVGRVNVQPKQLAVPVKLPPVVPAAIEDWVARGDAEHPLVRKARLALEVAQLETEKAKAGHLPTVGLTASYGRGHSEPNIDGFGYTTPTTSASIGVQLTVPLYAGNSIQNRVKETLALETKSEDDLAAARRGVEQATRTAFYGVRSGNAQVGALEAAESSSQLALDATQLGYKVGVRVNIDVLNAQAQLYSTQAQLAQARYNVVMAGLRLRQASGRLTADDVAAVNQLLQR